MKDDLMRLGSDLAILKERLRGGEREKQRLGQCLEEATELLKAKGEETERLKEEASVLRVQHAQEESRTEVEIRNLRRELDALRLERQTELGELKESNHEALASKVRAV